MTRLLAAVLCFYLLQACSDSGDNVSAGNPPVPQPSEPELRYVADIVWTEYGIPHVTAEDWGSLGYGYGYAYARENFCVAMKEFVRAAGESARYLGEEGDLNADLIYKFYNSDERIQRIFVEAMPEHVMQLSEGYAAGLNRYLKETGIDNLAEGEEGCRGAAWVRAVDWMDMGRLMHKRILLASGDTLTDFMVAATPPGATAALALPRPELLASLPPSQLAAKMGMPENETTGSNAYAVGATASRSSGGVLLGNPHFPWQGTNRFFMSHLTIPGQYDVMGASLHGLPLVIIGFNQDVAWSHTVSTAQRFTFYELTLNPDNPLEYLYDGEVRALEPVTVTAETVREDGTVQTVTHTFYLSHYGPIVDLGALSPLLGGWPNTAGTIIAYRDANLENLRGLSQWIKMGQAADLGELQAALADIGLPWVNTLAADRYGDALYADVSTVPHVTQQQFDSCVRGLLQLRLTAAGRTTLDGSDSACEWGSDEGAPAGVLGYDSLPKLETREYVANANASYWLSNPRQLLEGFSPVIGHEGVEQSLRTRLTFVQAEERLAGTDGLGEPGFSNEKVRQMLYGSRNLPAELVLDDVVGICRAVTDWSPYSSSPAAVAQACDILAAWDTRHTIDSVGGHIFYEFWLQVDELPNLWAVPFDPTDPVNTPRTLNIADSYLVEAVRQGLADGVQRLLDNRIALDAPWGEVQFDEKNGVRYPLHGGAGRMTFSVMTSNLIEGEGYANITHGNSYIQAVSWDETDCPDANAILTYSQSTDPISAHFADATELYSHGGWIDLPFCEADIEAQAIGREHIEALRQESRQKTP